MKKDKGRPCPFPTPYPYPAPSPLTLPPLRHRLLLLASGVIISKRCHNGEQNTRALMSTAPTSDAAGGLQTMAALEGKLRGEIVAYREEAIRMTMGIMSYAHCHQSIKQC